MSANVLVVDDSLTIQKVVSITLAKSGHVLTAAHDENELFSELEKQSFDLILLDFNLSESLTGYELAKKIKDKSSGSKILAMIGTFDNVNDSELAESGIDDSIIKPFESTKFIETCNNLVGVSSETEVPLEKKDIFSDDNLDEDDDWETSSQGISNTGTFNIPLDEIKKNEPVTNSLKEEIEGWGMSLPDIIEASEVTQDMEGHNILMPPKIDQNEDSIEFNLDQESEDINETDLELNDDISQIGKEISDDDLLFPEVNETIESSDDSDLSSKLSSLGELNIDDEDEITLSVEGFDENDDELIKELEAESEEDDEFWAADSEDESEDVEIGPKLEEVVSDEIGVKLESVDLGPKLENISSEKVSIDHIIERLKIELAPMIEKMIEEKMSAVISETVERVAWEAIPDMAENLVRNEVKEISNKIQEKHSL